MLSAERPAGAAAGPGLALGAVGAVVASSSSQEIPGCEQVLEADVSARSGRFTASASLSCQTVNEYSYLDIAAYVTDAARSEVTVLTSAVVEDFNVDAVQTIEITGAVEPGQILFFDSLALTSNLDDLRIGYLQLEPSP